MKTNKAIVKRFRLTKTGKVVHKTCGQDHFNAREKGSKTKSKRADKSVYKTYAKTVKSYI
ncbi:MAG: 50S ribosomal protein L35 [Patescibacteria group bacterium]|nr:50S ribosomal protein L35 [Patescibacteria group bacterium]MDD5534169.1 50S ribosomal protein L35 [Patescibacteria group bacterium]